MLPSWIGELTQMQNLNVMANPLRMLPPELGQLRSLSVLEFDENIESPKPEVTKRGTAYVMEYLRKVLDGKYSGNIFLNEIGLEAFPDEVGVLEGIKLLDVSSNKIPSMPEDLGNLSSLTALMLQDNVLESLPSSIKVLVNLKSLILARNKLKELHSSIGKLACLEELDITDNLVTKLPMEMRSLTTLKTLKEKGNPLASPPREVICETPTPIHSQNIPQLEPKI
jgi:Leucine-rich repeat (LRR) protein